MGSEGSFNILSIDGGGARGIYAAQVLDNIERSFQVRIKDCFDLIAGTSTGSIIAGAIVTDIYMKEIVQVFERKASLVFKKKFYRCPLVLSRYSEEPLKTVLKDCLPSLTLSEIATPLMIMSSDVGTGGVYIFKSNYLTELNKDYHRDGDVKLRDAVLASCAAPTYFDPVVGKTLLADGGLWANNPSMISFTEAISKFRKEIDQVRILSIGTGHSAEMYSEGKRCWGLLTGWEHKKFISYVFDLQSQASANMAKLLLNNNYFRLDPVIDRWALDDTKHLTNLKALADKDFIRQKPNIRAFIDDSGGTN